MAHNNPNAWPVDINSTPVEIPEYPDMIIGAITSLKEQDGSSRQAIDRHLQNMYSTVLPPNHQTLLTHHLKQMKTNGALEMVKHSYALPGSIPIPVPLAQSESHTPSLKRKPGRPAKAKNSSSVPQSPPKPSTETIFVSLGLDSPAPQKRGRGRPPGAKNVSRSSPKPKSTRPRGRPPRMVRAGEGLPVTIASEEQPRPVKARGRPPKKVGVPGGRPRGRPRKDGMVGAVADKRVKRMGRPVKGGEAMKKARLNSGKPLGRPRKGAVPASQVAALQEENQELRNVQTRLVHFQAKARQTIHLVMPYFTRDSAPYAYGALQELEEMANSDMTAPIQALPPQAEMEQQPASQN